MAHNTQGLLPAVLPFRSWPSEEAPINEATVLPDNLISRAI